MKNTIENISFKRKIKVLLLFFMIFGIFSGYTFADEVSATDNLVEMLYKTLSFLSWGWIIFANLAGKLMTNDIVYGTFLHIDSVLWTFWNMMKNIANFILGGLVLVSVLKNLLSPVNAKDNGKPLDTIKNTLIAAILIQMSRFLVGIVLDISTVCTAAIGSFPSQFFVVNDEFKRDVRDTIGYVYNRKVVVDYTQSEPIYFEQGQSESQPITDDDMNSLLDTILPSTDSLSGPLIYIGMSVFDLRDFNKQNLEPGDNWGEFFLSVGINGIVVIAYSIVMLLLFIFNLMRILILWIVIPCMPIIILMKVFKLGDKLGAKTFSEISNIGNILKLIFKPVILTGTLSIVLIIMVLIKGIIVGNSDTSSLFISNGNTSMTSKMNVDETYNSSMKIDGLLDIGMNGFQEGFADIVVYLLGICLMIFVLKMATFKTGIGFIDNMIEGIFNKVKGIATAAPIIPIPGGKATSIEQVGTYINDKTLLTSIVGWNADTQNAIVNDMLGLGGTFDSLSETMDRDDFIAKAKQLLHDRYRIDNQKELDKNASALSLLYAKIGAWNDRNHSSTKSVINISKLYESEGNESTSNDSKVANTSVNAASKSS